MEYTWKFSSGGSDTRELEKVWVRLLQRWDRREHAKDEKQRYHKGFSLDEFDGYEGTDIASPETAEDVVLRKERDYALYEAMDSLKRKQSTRIEMKADGLSTWEIGRREGVDHKAVKKSIDQAKNKLAKELEPFV